MELYKLVLVILFAVGSGAAIALLGVVIGGLFVLRTKQNGYEPLLPPMKQQEDTKAVNMDDMDDNVDDVVQSIFAQRSNEDPALQANKAFKEQMNG